MIPNADTIIAAVRLVDPTLEVSEKAILAAVQHARELTRWPLEAPAAVFFAFAVRPRCVPAWNAKLATFLARDRVAEIGGTLLATKAELTDLQMQCRTRTISFDDVRAWFAERMPNDA